MSTKKTQVIALAGNPNVGKSTLFNALTGLSQHTGNWPGKTVSVARGNCERGGVRYSFIDLPGTYSLTAHSQEEEVARDFILSGDYDAVVCVCDATCLERSLILALDIISKAPRVIVCVNLIDEAKRKGIFVDIERLRDELSVPVVATSARRKKSIVPLLDTISGNAFSSAVIPVEDTVSKASEIAGKCISGNTSGYTSRTKRIDKIITSKFFSFPIMLLLLALIFWISIEGANIPSAFLSQFLGSFEAPLFSFLSSVNLPNAVVDALVFGVWRVLSWVVAVMLPPMAIFFPLFTLLEDLGFLPRVAFNLDRAFKACDACGKQSLTMCMGFGCNAAGVVGCRIIDSPRERILAMLTNSFVPCNGRFPSLITLISIFFLGRKNGFISSVYSSLFLTFLILIGIGMTFLASKLLSKTALRGEASSFALELPPYRRPQILKVIVRSIFDRTLFVLGRAAAVAAPAGLLIWLMANISPGGTSLLLRASGLLDPLGRALGLDGVILISFILGFPANEIVLPLIIMAYTANGTIVDVSDISAIAVVLRENGWTFLTALNTMLFSLMHWPCSTTLLTIKKETKSVKWTLLALILPTVFGVVLCLITTLLFNSVAL